MGGLRWQRWMEGSKWKKKRLIVVHAGGVDGWVDGANLVFKSKTNNADCHDEMNTEHYMEWFMR